jgi:hypothetical protein
MKRHKIAIKILLGCFLSLLFIPCLWFIINFKEHNISNQISDWGSFGDFFGGTINILISLFSLIILSYLTFLVSEQSNKENKKVNILLRRFDAYDKLSAYFPNINRFIFEIHRSVTLLNKKLEEDKRDIESIEEVKKRLYSKVDFFSEFYHFLYAFGLRYGHLFEYDFKSNFHTAVLENAKRVCSHFESIESTFEIGKENYIPYNHDLTLKLFEDLAKVINLLREELE